ncbi:MAG: hypothetical protein ABR899_04160, partial [Candidatus Krumholzibacteriaceae bacterium]
IERCTFSGNVARANGAGMYSESSSPLLVDCTLDHNVAQGGAGAIFIMSSFLSATGCVFTANHAGFGGAIYSDVTVNSSGSMVITACRFAGNTAGEGGAIDYPVGSSHVNNCVFEDNVSDGSGGGICASKGINLENCSFDRNVANGGGGVSAAGGSTLAKCMFRNNRAVVNPGADETGWGGGLQYNGGSATIDSCSFEGNTAESSGGGISFYLVSSEVTGCSFSGNTAGQGGGVYAWFSSQPRFARCVFSGNKATTAEGGGVYHISLGTPFFSRAEFADCSFSGNSAATNGGAVSNDDAEISLLRCIFDGNTAGQDGGGFISVKGGWLKPPSLDHCEFYNNAAVGRGGAVMLNRLDISQLVSCTLAGNTASTGGGLYCVEPGASGLTLQNCTLYSNRAESGQGGGIAMELVLTQASLNMQNTIIASSSLGEAVYRTGEYWSDQISCCDFYGNAGGDWTGSLEGYAGLNGNLSVDPLFCHPENYIFMLQPGSPCDQDESGCGLIGAWPAGCSTRAKGMNVLWHRPVRVRR